MYQKGQEGASQEVGPSEGGKVFGSYKAYDPPSSQLTSKTLIILPNEEKAYANSPEIGKTISHSSESISQKAKNSLLNNIEFIQNQN